MPKRSYKAVFFDLDGTLLPIDMDAFLKNYFNDTAAAMTRNNSSML